MMTKIQRSPHQLIVVLATVLTMGLTASLGVWQLSRASEKQTLEDLIESRAELEPWSERHLENARDIGEGLHRVVELKGEWVPSASVYLDNRPMSGRSGFILLTPLRLANSDRSILVQRGWVPRDFTDRTRVPTVETPEGWVKVLGRLAPPPSQLFELGEAPPGVIRQNVEIAAMASETGLDLLDASVLQTGPPDPALLRDWPRFAAGVQKHYGYAFQWFAMCASIGSLYLWFQIISPRRKHRPHGPESR